MPTAAAGAQATANTTADTATTEGADVQGADAATAGDVDAAVEDDVDTTVTDDTADTTVAEDDAVEMAVGKDGVGDEVTGNNAFRSIDTNPSLDSSGTRVVESDLTGGVVNSEDNIERQEDGDAQRTARGDETQRTGLGISRGL